MSPYANRITKKTAISLTAAACLLGAVSTASAQDNIGTFGVDGAIMMPTGDWSHAASVGIGALADVQYGLTPELEVTGRGGFVYHLQNHNFNTWELPILGGAKYGFGQRGARPYVAAEIGLTSWHVSMETTNPFTGEKVRGSDSELDLSMTLGGGYELDRLDFRGAIYILDLGHAGDTVGILGSVGYAFLDF